MHGEPDGNVTLGILKRRIQKQRARPSNQTANPTLPISLQPKEPSLEQTKAHARMQQKSPDAFPYVANSFASAHSCRPTHASKPKQAYPADFRYRVHKIPSTTVLSLCRKPREVSAVKETAETGVSRPDGRCDLRVLEFLDCEK